MHLLILHQNFVDQNHPGGTRHLELARYLAARGHRCTIVASNLDFLTGRPVQSTSRTATPDRVRILRAYALPWLHVSYIGRSLSYLSFMITSVWVALRAGPVDAVLGTSPPLFQVPSSWLVARLRRAAWILEIRDLWPKFAVQAGVLRSPWLIRLAEAVERLSYRLADHIVVNSPGFLPHVAERGIAPDRVTVIPNGVEAQWFAQHQGGTSFRRRWGLEGKFVALYAGAFGRANDLDVMLGAAERLRGHEEIRIVLVGDGKERRRIEEQVRRANLRNVVLAGPVPKKEMPEVLAAADVCIAALVDCEAFRTTYPNKVFDYMAAGRPTLLAIDGVIRQVVEEADAGQFTPPGNAQQLAESVLHYHRNPQLAQRQGASAAAYVRTHFDRARHAAQLEELTERLIRRPAAAERWYARRGKRIFDLLLSAILLLPAVPLMAIVAIAVAFSLGRPVLFRQERAGRHGKKFWIYKFRTMREAADSQGHPLPDDQRLTRLGRFLRRYSLDELPQLWNVLRGDLSLVGPRPLLVRYLDRYLPWQARRHQVRPGITGWAQVHGRNALSWNEKFRLDVWYVDHVSFTLDLKILAMTCVAAIRGSGISSEGHVTMPEFMGSESTPPSQVNMG